jgi:methylenetetrahydrofolate reductase (NADPH)
MKISQLFQQKSTVYSFEVFPPKKTSGIETIYQTLEELKNLSPDYISVTYGAGGNLADQSTCEIASLLKNQYHIEPLAHLTCINSTKKDIALILEKLKENNIENILALRGDRNPDKETTLEFHHADELTHYIKQNGDFCVAGACYPEGHCECDSIITDTLNLRNKVKAGADFLISQLFLDNSYFYQFVERCRIANINVPIQAGIMPVVNKKQIERLVSLCGASLPAKFVKIVNRYEYNPEALRDAGIAYAVDQIVDLIANGVEGIHLYTMNNPYVAQRITNSIQSLIKE